MIDAFGELKTYQISCLDKGFVRLVDCMPRICPDDQTPEFRIVQSARVSYAEGTKTINEDRGLIRYLVRHRHTSPLEKIRFEFHVKLPLFVRSQWQRHRTGSFNEISARYSVMKDEFYIPDKENVRLQSKKNKQVSEGQVSDEVAESFIKELKDDSRILYKSYIDYMEKGIGREQARIELQQNLYTEFYWTVDLHNLLQFLALRCDKHAQQEVQVYGNAIIELIKPLVPVTIEAWEDYHPLRQAVLFTALEVKAIKKLVNTFKNGKESLFINIDSSNKGEIAEWIEKAERLGL